MLYVGIDCLSSGQNLDKSKLFLKRTGNGLAIVSPRLFPLLIQIEIEYKGVSLNCLEKNDTREWITLNI